MKGLQFAATVCSILLLITMGNCSSDKGIDPILPDTGINYYFDVGVNAKELIYVGYQ